MKPRLFLIAIVCTLTLGGCFDPGYSLKVVREKIVVNSVSNGMDGRRFIVGVSMDILVDTCGNQMDCLKNWIESALIERHVCTSRITHISYIQGSGEIQASGICAK